MEEVEEEGEEEEEEEEKSPFRALHLESSSWLIKLMESNQVG